MLMAVLKAEADTYVKRHRAERDEQGHAPVVRNDASRGGRFQHRSDSAENKFDCWFNSHFVI
jgi:hypothetical protein